MKIGAILPHLGQFGGVRRFLEIGNVFLERGHDFVIFSRIGKRCSWFRFKGHIASCDRIHADHVLAGDPLSFQTFPQVRGKIYVYVLAGGKFIDQYKTVYGRYPFILNNRIFKRWFPKSHLVEGGVNTRHFHPLASPESHSGLRVLYYERGGKNSDFIKQSLHGIKGLELVPLKGLSNDQLPNKYRSADFLVTWEGRPGWCNTAAEALASGLTVVSNGINCEPFAEGIIQVKDLRQFFENRSNWSKRKSYSMDEFSWEQVVDKLMRIFKSR